MYCILSPSGSTEPSPLIEIVPPGKAFMSSPALALGALFLTSFLLFSGAFL